MTVSSIESFKYILVLSMHFETLVRLYVITLSNTGLIKYCSIHLKQIRFFSSLISKLGFKMQAMTSIDTFYHINQERVHDEGAVSQQHKNTMFRTPFILIIALSPLYLFQPMFTLITRLVYFQELYEIFYM